MLRSIARFGALHMIGCGLLKGDKFFCRDRALSIFIFSAEKEIALVSIEQYDPVRISKNKSAKFTSRISWP
jgi:hypothetical protein